MTGSPALADLVASPGGLYITRGDRVLVPWPGPLDEALRSDMTRDLETWFPGVEFVFIAGSLANHCLVYRQPLIETRQTDQAQPSHVRVIHGGAS